MKRLLRGWKVGAKIQRLKRALDYGPRVEIECFLARRRYLRTAISFPPLSGNEGPLDCFMLLNEPRLWEGIWSLYSFRLYFGHARLIVLSDGTLKPESIAILKSLFPGVFIPHVTENDAEIDLYLAHQGLARCRDWRKRFVFFRKLIDPQRLSQSDRILLLDSDCLHFRPSYEVRSWAEAGKQEVRFIADTNPHSFCAPAEMLSEICGAAMPEHFCAGYLCLPKASIDLNRIERYLSEKCFADQLASGRFSHVAEQTLYAMEAAVIGGKLFPDEYSTCPDPDTEAAVMGHFCGGGFRRTWFYTKGIPLISRQIGARPHWHESA